MGAPLYSGEWQLMKETPYERVWIMAQDEHHLVVKCETLMHSMQAEANAEHLKASDGKRWGEGQAIARVPLDIWFKEVLPRKMAGDIAGLKRFYNDPDNRWLRTFKGRI